MTIMVPRIRASVGLPIYENLDIAWLAMEGLCNQTDAPMWELIIVEDSHPGQILGQGWFEAYHDRLGPAGCVRLVYCAVSEWQPLPVKWNMMAQMASDSSVAFMLHGSDDYSPPDRIRTSYELIEAGYDWVSQRHAVFYELKSGRLAEFDALHGNSPIGIGPNIALLTKSLRRAVTLTQVRANDGHLYKCCCPQTPTFNKDIDWKAGIFTHGSNMISNRDSWFDITAHDWLTIPEYHAADLKLPLDVMERLEMMKEPQEAEAC